MRWNGLGRSLLFAAVVALSWVPFAWLVVPGVGASRGLALFAGLVIPLYVVGLAPTLGRGVRLAFPCLLVAGAAYVLAPNLGVALLLMGMALALCRSGALYRSRPARAVLLESSLLFGGLLLAAWVGKGGAFAEVLGIWTFFLVQSAFFVVGAVSSRETTDAQRDPFESARDRLQQALEGL